MDPNDPNREKQSGWEQEEQIARQAADELRGKAQKAAEKKITQSSAYKTASTAANKGLTAAKAGVKQVGSKVAAKLGLKGAAALAGTAFGGPLGTAVMYALAEVAEKLLGAINRGLKKLLGEDYKKQLAALGLGMAATGAAVASSPLLIGGAAMTGGVALVSGTGAVTGGIVMLGRVFRGWGKVVVSGLIPALIFFFIGIPIIVSIIIFIINTGGWVYPSWQRTGVRGGIALPTLIDSPYIEVTKIAQEEGGSESGSILSFDNSDLPIRITYTITVVAELSTLTNIQFDTRCDVISDTGQTCPSAEVTSEINPFEPDTWPTQITPQNPITITYRQLYNETYTDAIISDTFTVTATAEGRDGEVSQARAFVRIGNPQSCPSRWPRDPYEEDPIYITQGPGYPHRGPNSVDIRGTLVPVYSTHAGIVEIPAYAGGSGGSSNYGNYVKIISVCENEFASLYAHLSTIEVQDGQLIGPNTQIGVSGNSGNTVFHIHYEFQVPPSSYVSTDYTCPPNSNFAPYMAPPYIPSSPNASCN